MAVLQVTATTPRSDAPTLPGTWKLVAGRAITLQPREAGVLKVAHGQLWATYDGPHRGALNDSGDYMLGVGDQLRLRPGQRLVVEAWNGGAPAFFSWDSLPVAAAVNTSAFAALVQPLADLRLALSMGAAAAGRLVMGLGGVVWQLIAGRAQPGFEEQCCARHGAMN